MLTANTAITSPTMAYIRVFFAASIFWGLPPETRYIMPATTIIMVAITPTSLATVEEMASKRAGRSFGLNGFEITTPEAKAEPAKENKITRDIRERMRLFIFIL